MSYWPPRFSLNFGALGKVAPARLATLVLLYFGLAAQLPPGTVPVPAAFSTLWQGPFSNSVTMALV
ncbi:hypothetical protein D3C86_2201420 [compost metagenome]